MYPANILMCKPEYFEVNYHGNEFMKDNIGGVNKSAALEQWEGLKNVYEKLGYAIKLIKPVKSLVDMVFTANLCFPFIDKNGNKTAILSKMKNSQRKEEVKYLKQFLHRLEYEVIE